ncbi:hypothetical protein N7481_001915 [Penicillium waksmanii]|uniref:uncharacterized protein n=1 Tax=Penicillium waksmanii TaxID=69791 RepID=UPI0025491945|nr:uncharacterized protein N7481_001915 [Penicillium waksmanii]KAJ5994938.1 hypothetical protein N7481_001915 [Penicillium waksmanii]
MPESFQQRKGSSSNAISDISSWNFDIDRFLNPLIPVPRWNLIPQPIAHFLGYRSRAPKPLGNVMVAFWSMVGAFVGVALVASVSKRVPSFEDRNAPAIIGSFGAAAVIEFCVVESPLAQPRNAFFSQLIACVVGVGISKLFALNPNAEHYIELGGALACGVTTALMVLTGTVHPPAGATALLAVTNEQTVGLGWFLFPVMILGITLMQSAALVVNNIQRRYPMYWWTSQPLSRAWDADVESDREKRTQTGSQYEESLTDLPRRLVVERGDIWVPNGVFVSAEERQVLDRISARL